MSECASTPIASISSGGGPMGSRRGLTIPMVTEQTGHFSEPRAREGGLPEQSGCGPMILHLKFDRTIGCLSNRARDVFCDVVYSFWTKHRPRYEPAPAGFSVFYAGDDSSTKQNAGSGSRADEPVRLVDGRDPDCRRRNDMLLMAVFEDMVHDGCTEHARKIDLIHHERQERHEHHDTPRPGRGTCLGPRECGITALRLDFYCMIECPCRMDGKRFLRRVYSFLTEHRPQGGFTGDGVHVKYTVDDAGDVDTAGRCSQFLNIVYPEAADENSKSRDREVLTRAYQTLVERGYGWKRQEVRLVPKYRSRDTIARDLRSPTTTTIDGGEREGTGGDGEH
ncbi:uncharacterized protein LTR77_010996 [Saxophila tyrrhenica]|uniref:Uncharacterized protein n=1 Tax=Saxophila tyrrhenica TaxID=1690608 RepID=A0AAV9NXW5_9PEZI|nr:hypothetical protein LTR77_010996 [Saxophila tyrrhenica]